VYEWARRYPKQTVQVAGKDAELLKFEIKGQVNQPDQPDEPDEARSHNRRMA
jgi:hypothetical protein